MAMDFFDSFDQYGSYSQTAGVIPPLLGAYSWQAINLNASYAPTFTTGTA